jgi:hypothetical protein
MNKAPSLLLIIGLIVELVKNKELGCKVAGEGSKGLLWIPLPRGGIPSKNFPVFDAGSVGGMG